jgi:hypothetical protein
MDKIIKQGQLLFAVAVIASGAEQLICAQKRLQQCYPIGDLATSLDSPIRVTFIAGSSGSPA